MALVITKITKQIPQSAPLETFLTTLGVNTKTELYLCNAQAYINSDIILPVLSVTIQWFIKNAETPLHYLKIKPKNSTSAQIYINKYGITKLLAQSKEAVAFKLQDYLYELLYKVETQGYVSKDEVGSRNQLMQLTADLTMYRSSASSAITETIELKESINSIRADYAAIEAECQKLKSENEKYLENIQELESELTNYKNIANKMSRFVRVNTKKPPTEAYDDSLDVDEDEELDEVTKLEITTEAIKAKNNLKNPPSKKPKVKQTTSLTKQKIIKLTLLQSSESSWCEYKWELSDKEYDEDFKLASQDYRLGDIDTPPDLMIWYADLEITEEKRKMITLFLSLHEYCNESVIQQLIE